MMSKFIETVLKIPNEDNSSAKALINIEHINFIEENKEDKTTWIILDGSQYHDIVESLECYDAIKNSLLEQK